MRVPHGLLLSSALVGTTACTTETGADSGAPAAACAAEAAPAAAPVGGDANADGHVDVSDGVYLAHALLAAGPAPACAAAVDLVPDGDTNLGDVPALWYAIGPRTAPYLPTVEPGACPAAPRPTLPGCGDGLALSVEAPARVDGAAGAPTSFDATVVVTAPTQAVEAWSFVVRAEGCTLAGGSTAGTLAADRGDGTGGLRADGFAWQAVEPAEARAMTVLDWRTQAALPTGGPQAVHTLTVTGTAASPCTPCVLSVVAGDPATTETVVTVDGWRYAPALGRATVELCAG